MRILLVDQKFGYIKDQPHRSFGHIKAEFMCNGLIIKNQEVTEINNWATVIKFETLKLLMILDNNSS